jgi:lipid A 4'-phosphatase
VALRAGAAGKTSHLPYNRGMSFSVRLILLCVIAAALCGVLFINASRIDIAAAAAFYDGSAFPWRSEALPNFFHDLVHPLSLTLAAVFAALLGYHVYKKSGWRRWLFLLLTLIVGPGLLTNTLFKDNWGRARPLQVEQFGGTAQFTPPFVMADQCAKNCSFVSGDAAFGFWFHSFAYIAPRRRKALFYTGLGIGAGYGLLRIGMGAHFLSDVFAAGLLMLLSSAALYALLFGRKALGILWREWLGGSRLPT